MNKKIHFTMIAHHELKIADDGKSTTLGMLMQLVTIKMCHELNMNLFSRPKFISVALP